MVLTGVLGKFRLAGADLDIVAYLKRCLPVALVSLFLWSFTPTPVYSQDGKYNRKVEKTRKKQQRKKDRKAGQFQGKIEPGSQELKGNPTKTKRKKSTKFQDRIGAGKVPGQPKGTRFGGRSKRKSIEKSQGTRYSGQAVETERKVKGNPTKLKGTSGKNYQDRIGANKAPSGTKGTNFKGRGRVKSVESPGGTNYRGETQIQTGVKGNPTRGVGKRARKTRYGAASQGPPNGTDGTNFSGNRRPKSINAGTEGTRFSGNRRPKQIPSGSEGTTYSGQSTTSSTSSGGRRTTIYGERGWNNTKGGVPDIKLRNQGAEWKGNIKGHKYIEGAPGTTHKGNLKLKRKQILDYGGDWAGDLKVKKRKKDNRASTFTMKGFKPKELGPAPGTTFKGHLRSPKKINSWDGSDYAGDLKVRRNKKVKTDGTKFAGHLKVRPNARIKTEGTDFRGNHKVTTRFFQNQYFRKKSRQEQQFAGNYKIRRTKGKDLHPSAWYTGRQVHRSETAETINRKWKLLWAKTNKNSHQPKHLKKKGKKPKYDPKESEIWND